MNFHVVSCGLYISKPHWPRWPKLLKWPGWLNASNDSDDWIFSVDWNDTDDWNDSDDKNNSNYSNEDKNTQMIQRTQMTRITQMTRDWSNDLNDQISWTFLLKHCKVAYFEPLLLCCGCLSIGIDGTYSKELRNLNFVKPSNTEILSNRFGIFNTEIQHGFWD